MRIRRRRRIDIGVLAGLAAAVAGTWLVRRAGREWVAAGGAAEAAFDPGAGPVRRVDPADKVAWLIGAAVDGYLDLEGEGRQVTLVRRPRRDGAPAYLLDMAFGGRDRLTLGSYDVSFASAWRLVGIELDGWRRTSALWDPAGDRRRALARVLGVVAGVAGLVLIGVGAVPAACGALAGPGWPALVVAGGLLAGAGAATCASTPPGRWPWASWTAGRGRGRVRRRCRWRRGRLLVTSIAGLPEISISIRGGDFPWSCPTHPGTAAGRSSWPASSCCPRAWPRPGCAGSRGPTPRPPSPPWRPPPPPPAPRPHRPPPPARSRPRSPAPGSCGPRPAATSAGAACSGRRRRGTSSGASTARTSRSSAAGTSRSPAGGPSSGSRSRWSRSSPAAARPSAGAVGATCWSTRCASAGP